MANKLVSYFRKRSRLKRGIQEREFEDPQDLRFDRPVGMAYEAVFRHIHATYLFDWYMEVGCRTGAIFAHARGKTVGVDPYFLVTTNVIGSKPALHLFQTTSDDFFATKFLDRNQIKLSFSFLDGMHLFEYLLRDFINTEHQSDPKGVIALHDCCPFDVGMTTRDLQNLPKRSWTGDVWKLIPILQHYRPDLKITVLNCYSTGLVLVSNLSPTNNVLSQNYDAIVAEYMDVDIEGFGIDAFFSSFTYTDAQAFLKSADHLFGPLALKPEAELTPVYVTP